MFDLRDMLRKIWYGRWIILISIFVFLAVAMLVASRFEPVYKASATVMFGVQRATIVDLQEVLATPDFDQNTLENEIQVLMSTNLISRVVRSLDLVNNPEFNPELIELGPSLIERIDASMSLPDGMRKFLIEAGFLTLPAPPLSIAEAERRGYLATVETVRSGRRPDAGGRIAGHIDFLLLGRSGDRR